MFLFIFTFSKPNRMSESSTVAALMLISSIMAQGQFKICQTFYLFITSGGSRGGEGNVRPLDRERERERERERGGEGFRARKDVVFGK